MLLTMLFDDEDEEYVSALFQVGDQVRGVALRPAGGCSGATADAHPTLTLQLHTTGAAAQAEAS
jgi:hypothetical protein